LAWRIEVEDGAKKDIARLDPPVANRFVAFLRDRLQKLENPRSIGEALHGKRFGEFWKYRIGDVRIIARIEDKRLIILVVHVGHRKQVYK
jgi:mRNA interferase RelE/StbE